jgi:hypothetical protein
MAGGPVTLMPGDCEFKRALGPVHLITVAIVEAGRGRGLGQGGYS